MANEQKKTPAFNIDFAFLGPDKRTPEQNLLISTIVRAIYDLHCGDKEFQRTAKRFLFSRSKRVFGFLWMCMKLNLSPDIFLQRYAQDGGKSLSLDHPYIRQRSQTFTSGSSKSASRSLRAASSGFLDGKFRKH